MKNNYRNQVSLLLTVLPEVSKLDQFVLKGGTAINFFIRDFPRLSVDIDLIYLPLEGREDTLLGVENGLCQIRDTLSDKFFGINVRENINKKTKTITRLDVIGNDALVKIEPNLILRGTVFEPSKMDISQLVQDNFGVSIVGVPVANMADLYGGEICAALDRQHPRDLFDIKVLLDNEGITFNIKQAFLVYLCSHNRPMHEVLSPNFFGSISSI